MPLKDQVRKLWLQKITLQKNCKTWTRKWIYPNSWFDLILSKIYFYAEKLMNFVKIFKCYLNHLINNCLTLFHKTNKKCIRKNTINNVKKSFKKYSKNCFYIITQLAGSYIFLRLKGVFGLFLVFYSSNWKSYPWYTFYNGDTFSGSICFWL